LPDLPNAESPNGKADTQPAVSPDEPDDPSKRAFTGRLSSHMARLVIGQGLTLVATVGGNALLVRLLVTKEAYGAFRGALVLTAVMAPMIGLGFGESLNYFLPRRDRNRNYVAQSFLWCLSWTALLLTFSLIGGGRPFARIFGHSAQAVGPYAVLLAGAGALAMLARTTLISVGQSGKAAGFQVALAGAVYLGACFCAWQGWSVLTVVSACIVARLSVTAVALWTAAGRVGPGGHFRPTWGTFRQHLVYAVPVGLSILTVVLGSRFHLLWIYGQYSESDFAIYSVAWLFIPFVNRMIQSVAEVVIPTMSAAEARGDRAVVGQLWRDATSGLAFFTVGVAVFLFGAAPELIRGLFTDQFADAVAIFRTGVWAIVVLTFCNASSALRAIGDTRYHFAACCLRLVTAVIAVLVLTPWFGLKGAVVSPIIAAVAMRLMEMIRVRRHLRMSWGRFLPWATLAQVVLAGGLAGSGFMLFKDLWTQLPLHKFLLLGIDAVVFSLGYFAACWVISPFFRGIARDFLTRLRQATHR